MSKSEVESAFLNAWHQHDLDEPEREYRFHNQRKWRFDFAFPAFKVAVEIEGGTFGRSRHTTGKGHHNDCDKYNAATELGWKVLRYTAKHLKDDADGVVEQVCEVLNGAA